MQMWWLLKSPWADAQRFLTLGDPTGRGRQVGGSRNSVFCVAGRLEHPSAMSMEQQWRMQLCQADGAESHPSMKNRVLLRTPGHP